MAEYIEWEKKKYQDIPEQDMPQNGEAFICRSQDYENPFDDWDYIVGVMGQERPEALGKFKDIQMARILAAAI